MNTERIMVFKRFVLDLSTLSKCNERHVAAVVTDIDFSQIYSIGVNGGPKHLDDCMCVTEGKYGCIHAEVNALIKCNSADKNKVMFVTLAPCKQCAAAIINSDIHTLFYVDDWKENSGIQLLKRAGIYVQQI
jgi:dCMP deaminase